MTTTSVPLVSHSTPYGIFEVYTSDPKSAVSSWIEVTQVHSGDVAHYFPHITTKEIYNVKADAIFMTKKEFSQKTMPNVLIKTADCLPILLASSKCVAMIHAGWRGLHKKILSHPLIKSMQPDVCYIGPHICQKCYEVGPEFTDHFPNSSALVKKDSKWYFGQKEEASIQLNSLFPNLKIVDFGLCTFCDNRLHSYRRGHQNQRNYNIFKPHS